MISDDESSHQVSYWPSVSDLFMTLFIIAIALVGSMLFVFLPNPGCKYIDATLIPRLNDLRQVLGSELRVPENSSRDDLNRAVGDTIEEATRRLKAMKALVDNSDALLVAQEQIQTLERKVANLTEQLAMAREMQASAEKKRDRLNAELAAAKKGESGLQAELDNCRRQVTALGGAPGGNDKPPIITVSGADKRHFFVSGKADVSAEFETDLGQTGFQEIAAEILKRNSDGRLNVDTLEIIGHTDGIPVARSGNLDAALPALLRRDSKSMSGLKPGSNNDLGLLRALAIKQAWEKYIDTLPDRERLQPIKVRTYSAGQTIPPEGAGRFEEDNPKARRIELRLTKLADDQVTESKPPAPQQAITPGPAQAPLR